MPHAETIRTFSWIVSIAGQLLLTAALFRSGNYRQYPFFTAYNLTNVGQVLAVFLTYHYWGPQSSDSYVAFWATQGLTVLARALAVSEFCWRLLGSYRGIWALAWRLLSATGMVIFAYSFLITNGKWRLTINATQRGLELAIASAIVVLLAFSRYYRISIAKPDRFLAFGFCLYSCAIVLNNTILERFFDRYREFWSTATVLSFIASLLIWLHALRLPVPVNLNSPVLLHADAYRRLSPQINDRLRALNRRLMSFWRLNEPEP